MSHGLVHESAGGAASWHPAFRPNSTAELESAASWHPAFRPNSTAELESATDSTRDKAGHDGTRIDPGQPAVEDVNAHGQTEEDTGIHKAGRTPEVHIPDPAPQQRPETLSPIKALGEFENQDYTDPAWGFADEPKSLNYTNSFPPVPPLSESAAIPPSHPLPHSQAEAIIEADEQDESSRGLDDEKSARQDSWAEPTAASFDNEADFFSQSETTKGAPVEPSDAEARYEEGVPLVADQHEVKTEEDVTGTTTSAEVKGPFSPGFPEQSGGDDFFNKLGGSEDNAQDPPEHPGLDRKSTEQVLSTLQPQQHSARPNTLGETKSSDLAHLTGNGIAVSATTVVSQVLAEDLASKESPTAETPPTVKDEDLTALWEAALGDDELLDQGSAVDPSAFFDDDDEGFLGDTIEGTVPTPVHDSFGRLQGFDSLSRSSSAQPMPQDQLQGSQGQNRYAPASGPTAVPQYPPAQAPARFPSYGGAPAAPPAVNPSVVSTPQSFADKSKGGYASPFDMPMDLSRAKRPSTRPTPLQQATNLTSPPPRSSSITSTSGPPQTMRSPPMAGQPSNAPPARSTTATGGSSFFEDLPMAPKARPPSTTGRNNVPTQVHPPQGPLQAPLQGLQQSPPQGPPPSRQYSQPPPKPQANSGDSGYGLVSPQREMSFSDGHPQFPPQAPQGLPASRTAPPPNNRYSPAPAGQSAPQAGPPAANRYAAPPVGGPPRAPSVSGAITFQPRTSSPLAHSSSAYQPNAASQSALPQQAGAPPRGPIKQPSLPPQSPYTPHQQMPQSHLARGVDPSAIERPQATQRGFIQDQQSRVQPQIRRTDRPPDDANFLPPTDGREQDPLKRWQGAPILQFGFGGSVVTSFPKRLPRYVQGQATPSIVCAPGEVKVHHPSLLPLDDLITSFPGPLKAKGKKKDVLQWLDRGIQHLENEMSTGNVPPALLSPPKRYEERILLWRIMRTLVEFDGNIEANPAAVTAVREALSPEIKPAQSGPDMYGGSYQPSGIIRHAGSPQQTSAGADAVEQIRKFLLSGDREKAVWHAVDQRLWGHAMIIASTLSKDIWKQVAQDFVKTDVKTVGDNVEPLAALYDIFAGNWEESMDQLVSSSARAGLQMVSKTVSGGPAKNAFEGLNHWRETVSLVLGNRSVDDVKSLASLGQLLSQYGRIEAAHICYMFARLPGLVSGADDPQAAIVLLGENHRSNPTGYATNLSSVLLTEVFEFATCVLAIPAAPALGHLQSFKLWHATMLAESGHSDQAQQYCDVIAASLKSSTKASPYYHAQLFAATDDLSSRLHSAPRDSSGKWMSKPNMDKVSGSVWNKFTQFVAGDDSDAASQASKADAEGPFARVGGDTPSISRGPSPGEQYGGYGGLNGHAPAALAAATNSRYAPKSNYGPQSAGVQKSPSFASMQSVSPSLPSAGQPPRNYQSPPKGMASAIGGPASRYSPAASGTSSPEAKVHESAERSLPQRQVAMDLDVPTQPSPVGISKPVISPQYGISPAQADAPGPPPPQMYQPPSAPERRSSPYAPRSAGLGARSSSYAPRSSQASPMETKPPSELQPSPMAYEPSAPPPDAPTANAGSYAPPATSSSADTLYPSAPTISQVPPTPTATGPPPSFGYEPSAPAFPGPSTEVPSATEQGGYEPPSALTGGSQPSGYAAPDSSYAPPSSGGYEPPSAGGYDPQATGYEPPGASDSYQPPSAGYAPPSAGYAPPSAGYAPPSAHFEPPSYQPNGSPMSPSESAPRKKSIMDEDEDDELQARAAALKKSQRADADRQADDAFRKAAEADAARDKGPELKSKSSGWLGGWFTRGGAGNDGSLQGPDGSKKPIKARLGEENSFYYDPNLKKWINKNAKPEDQAAAASPTPPPPKGAAPPGRNASPLGGPPLGSSPTSHPAGPPPMGGGPPMGAPPSGPVSRSASPGGADPGPLPPGGEPSGSLAPGIAPPSRPGTGMSGLSNASSIDDLIGAPQVRQGGTVRRKKGRGYVDVMAK